MVFEWVTTKFKERQLKKAQLQAEADHMVIVAGLSILNPTARTFFKDMPFYDLETDTVDFAKLEKYIEELTHWKRNYGEKQCKECYAYHWFDKNMNVLHDFVLDIRLEENRLNHKGSEGNPYSLSYTEKLELERFRELFMKFFGDDNTLETKSLYHLRENVEDYLEQYRNLDETISNFENKIYQKNKEIERLQTLLDEKPVKEVVKVIEKEDPKDKRPVTRSSKIYNKFKLAVLKRDKVCQCCGSSENLHVHHISSYKHDKQRRADTSNGIVLCEDCHHQFHSLYGKGHKNNPVNFSIFMREYANAMQVNLDYVIADEISEEMVGGK